MKTIWFKDCKSEKDREDLKISLRNDSNLYLLRELLEAELRDLDNREVSTQDYSTASWSHLQAHRNGYRQHLVQTQNLLNFEQSDPSK